MSIPYAKSPTIKLAKTIALIAIFLGAIFICWTVASRFLTILNLGQVTTFNVEAYQDPECTLPLTQIDWGVISPNTNKTALCYLHNEGNTPITLAMNTSDYAPANFQAYSEVSWDYNGAAINPNATLTTHISLRIFDNITGIQQFSFSINIWGLNQ